MTAKEFVDKLGENAKAKAKGDGWIVCCPAHTDKTQSLSIHPGKDGRVLVKCFAGCSTESVCTAAKVEIWEIMGTAAGGESKSSKIVATYDYRDASGALLFQTCRMEPKDFRQRRPDGAGDWIWNLKGVPTVPYRLPECLKAIAEGKTLLVAEGEKDCDRLWSEGFPATCNPMGAKKWREEHTDVLCGTKRATVIADKDDPGREHAVLVAKSLQRICPDVHVMQFPDINGYKIKDAHDWFSHGGKRDQFISLESCLPPFDPEAPFPDTSEIVESWSVSELMQFDPTCDPNAIVGLHDGKTSRYLCKGYGAWIIGQSGIGKSSISYQQAYHFALNKPFFGITPVRALRILIVQNENDKGDCAEATQGIMDGLAPSIEEFAAINERVKVLRCRGKTGAQFCLWLHREIDRFQADIVYVDPLIRFAGIEVSRQDQCTRFLNDHLDPVLAKTGCALIGAHHTGKPKSAKETQGWTIYDYAYSGIGSSELVNWARAITIIRVLPDNNFEMILSKRGPRAWATHPDGSFTTSLYLKHALGRICWEQTNPPEIIPETRGSGKSAGRPSKVDQIAGITNTHSFLASCKTEGEGLNEISKRLESWLAKEERLDMSTKTCKRAIPALVANGKLTKTDAGLYIKGPNA